MSAHRRAGVRNSVAAAYNRAATHDRTVADGVGRTAADGHRRTAADGVGRTAADGYRRTAAISRLRQLISAVRARPPQRHDQFRP